MRWFPLPWILSATLVSGAEWWVDGDNGDDSQSGSRETPFRTIGAGLEKLVPGATLHILPRSAPWPGDVRITSSGTREQPIVIEGHGSLVSGRGTVSLGEWTDRGSGIYSRPLPNNAWGMERHWEGGFPLVWFDGKPAENVTAREALRPGCFFLYKNRAEQKTDPLHNTLFISLPEDGVLKIETIVGEGGIFVGGDHVTVRNFVVEYGGRDGFATHRNVGVVFEGVEARYFMDQGMSHHGASVTVRNSLFHKNAGGGVVDVYPEAVVRYENCVIENDTWRGGVEFHSGVFTMTNCTLRGNPKTSLTVTKGARVRLEACWIEGFGDTGIRLGGGSQLEMSRCTIRGFPFGLRASRGPGSALEVSRSLFLDCGTNIQVEEVVRSSAPDVSESPAWGFSGNVFGSGKTVFTRKDETETGWKVETTSRESPMSPDLPEFFHDSSGRQLTAEESRSDGPRRNRYGEEVGAATEETPAANE